MIVFRITCVFQANHQQCTLYKKLHQTGRTYLNTQHYYAPQTHSTFTVRIAITCFVARCCESGILGNCFAIEGIGSGSGEGLQRGHCSPHCWQAAGLLLYVIPRRRGRRECDVTRTDGRFMTAAGFFLL
jgi:hypothetical protein